MKKVVLVFVLNLVFFTSCESDKDVLEEESISVAKVDDTSSTEGFEDMEKQMDLFTDNLKNKNKQAVRSLIGNIPNVNIVYSGTTQNVTGNLILNQTPKRPGTHTQWLTFDFTGFNFFGGHSSNQAGTHVAIGLFGHASTYLSGVGLILGAEGRGAQYSTAYYESYWRTGNHLDFSPTGNDDYPFSLSNHPPLSDFQRYKLILHVNDNGWIWFRILDNNYNIVMDRVRRYVNPNLDELLSSTGIFIAGLKNYPFPNNSYQLSLSNVNYGWF